MSSLLCLAGDGVVSTIFAAALHLAWTRADGIAREESWHIRQGVFEFFAARIRKNEGWEHYWPTRPPQARLVLDRRGLREDYLVCGEMWCKPLEKLVPRAKGPVVQVAPC